MDTLTMIIVAVIGSNGLFSIIMLLMQRHFAKKDERSDEFRMVKKSLEALAHDAYFRDCRHLMQKDEITPEELENHNYLYNTYHSLGLNGTGDRMHELVLEKPVHVKGE